MRYRVLIETTSGFKVGEIVSDDDRRFEGHDPSHSVKNGCMERLDTVSTAKAEADETVAKVKAEAIAAMKELGKERDEARAEADKIRKQAEEDAKKLFDAEVRAKELEGDKANLAEELASVRKELVEAKKKKGN